MKRVKGIFVIFYCDVLNTHKLFKEKVFEWERRKFAIRCNTLKEQQDCAHNIVSMDGIKNVRYAKSCNLETFKVVPYEKYRQCEVFMFNKEPLTENEDETFEWCPYCECEVIIKADCNIIQTCPTCGKPIIACSMCEKRNCSKCKFSH